MMDEVVFILAHVAIVLTGCLIAILADWAGRQWARRERR